MQLYAKSAVIPLSDASEESGEGIAPHFVHLTTMNSKRITFKNSRGIELGARLEKPSNTPRAWAIFAHCFTCSKDLNAVISISRALTLSGIAVLRFDFTGLGESEGEFSDTDFTSNIGDLLSAAEYLEKEHEAPSLLIGHSLGGAAVLAAAPKIEQVRAVATLGAPADPVHVEHLLKDQLEEIESEGKASVSIGGRPFTVTREFLEDIRERDLEEIVPDLKKALLILHSPQDRIVGIENARIIYERAKHPKSFISLDGSDHLLSDKKDAQYAGKVIAAWAERYLELEEKESLTEPERQVVVRTGDDGFTTEIRAGKHTYLADEPESVGGTDLGPTPYDLLISGLGACTSMTLRMYADRKGWPLEEAMVYLEHDKVHEKDCEKDQNPEARIDRIRREIKLKGELSDEQRSRLMEIADKCPVHKTLSGDIRIESSMVNG